MTDLLLAGDFYAPAGFIPRVSMELRSLIGSYDHAMVNLEGPITASDCRIPKSGPAITSAPGSARALRDFGFSGVILANNHIMDAARPGLVDTLDELADAQLRQAGGICTGHVGGHGQHLDLTLDGQREVRILAYCEHEWSVGSSQAGGQGWSLVQAARAVAEAKAEAKLAVVVLHGGNEYYPLPRPVLRNELRYLAEIGADAVVMHHNHVPSAYEFWRGVPICYGLGNFQFAKSNPRRAWHEGLLAGLQFTESGTRLRLIPIQTTPTFEVDFAEGESGAEILRAVEGYRLLVQSDEALESNWVEFCREVGPALLAASMPVPTGAPKPVARALERLAVRELTSIAPRLRTATNVLRCESLAEVVRTFLWQEVKERQE